MSSIRDSGKTFSIFVEKALPRFVDEDHPKFIEFSKKYFEYLEQDLNSLDLIINYLIYNDIDTIMDDLKIYYYQVYGSTLPQVFFNSFSFFIKHVREFYKMKGSEESFKYLFREFFDSPVDFFYPSKEVFRLSAANWYVPYYLVPETQDLDTINDFKNHVIRGQTSLAEGFVSETRYIEYSTSPLVHKYTLVVTNRDGFFVDNEEIKSLINPDLSLQLKQNDAIVEEEGQWSEREGILSGNFYLQDNYYYQDFSYEIQSTVDIADFKDLIRKTVHPAGFVFFSALKPYLGSLLIEHEQQELKYNIQIGWIRSKQFSDQLFDKMFTTEKLISGPEMTVNEGYTNPHDNTLLTKKIQRQILDDSLLNEFEINNYNITITKEQNNEVIRDFNGLKIIKLIDDSPQMFVDKIVEYDYSYFEDNLINDSVLDKYYKIGDFDTLPIEIFETNPNETVSYGYSSIINGITNFSI